MSDYTLTEAQLEEVLEASAHNRDRVMHVLYKHGLKEKPEGSGPTVVRAKVTAASTYSKQDGVANAQPEQVVLQEPPVEVPEVTMIDNEPDIYG